MSAPLPPPVLPPPSRPRGRPALSPEIHGTLGRLVEHRLSPRRLRWLFVFFVVALQALVWATYLNSVSVLERKAEEAFRTRVNMSAIGSVIVMWALALPHRGFTARIEVRERPTVCQ